MQNTLKIKRTKTALAFNLAIIACEIAVIGPRPGTAAA